MAKTYINKLALIGELVDCFVPFGENSYVSPNVSLYPTSDERINDFGDIIEIETEKDDEEDAWYEWEYTTFMVYSNQVSRSRNLEMISRYIQEAYDQSCPTTFLAFHINELRKVLGRKGYSKLCRRYGTTARQMEIARKRIPRAVKVG